MIFTDGVQTQNPRADEINPEDNAQKLKDKNVTIFAVGAGTTDPVELLEMASGPNYVIIAALENLGRAVNEIIERICKIELTVRKLHFITLQRCLLR